VQGLPVCEMLQRTLRAWQAWQAAAALFLDAEKASVDPDEGDILTTDIDGNRSEWVARRRKDQIK
jgi:hypothetical protein